MSALNNTLAAISALLTFLWYGMPALICREPRSQR